ncbi:helix-turn-helix domain-containing protein [Leisingera sp. ANG59]|nr:helix-turn-helix domain-containing protein [Leisingera sp. ANG59]
MMSVVTAIEPLRVANRILGENRYEWVITHEAGNPPAASNGLSLPGGTYHRETPVPDYTFVCAGMHTNARDPDRLFATLNRRARLGKVIGGVSLAAALLARAGLLTGRRGVIHWEGLPAVIEEFPDIDISAGLFEIDGPIMTSCGGLATLDLFLAILGSLHEDWLVGAVSNQLQISRTRQGTDQQHMGAFRLPVTAPKSMHKAVALIDQTIAEPLSPEALARAIGTSRRTLDRKFRTHTGYPAAEFYLLRRLERARNLLSYSNLPIVEVGLATGFRSASHFTTAFRQAYDITPKVCRQQAVDSIRSARPDPIG